MRTIATVVAQDQDTLVRWLDQLADAEYLAGRAGQMSSPEAGQPQLQAELWLLAMATPSAANPGQWEVIALGSDTDVLGWPYTTTDYAAGAIRGPADVAAALVAAGATVTLRHYSGFAVARTAETLPGA